MSDLSTRDNVIAKKVGRWKLIKASTKLYNSLCESCKSLVLKDSKMKIENYCKKCKTHVEEFAEEFDDDCQ